MLACSVTWTACGTESFQDDGMGLDVVEQANIVGDLGSARGNAVATVNTCGMRKDFPFTCQPDSTSATAVYAWTAPFTGNFIFTTAGASFATVLEVRPLANTAESLGCNVNAGSTARSRVSAKIAQGTTVLVVVGGTGTQCGTSPINITTDSDMHFGGMYGFFGGGTYVNPYTGGPSCPTGYTAYQTLGTQNVDYNMYFCGRYAVDGSVPVAEFGGAYGFGGSGAYKNDITQSASCPGGYLTDSALGSSGIDYDLRYCHRPHQAQLPSPYRFGGMYGEGGGGPYVNPLTGLASCPDGFKAVQILGTNNVDYPVYFCYRKA